MNILSIQSSVAYGHAGNSSAVFPLQRLGHEVWPVFTVHFSNHTGYGAWRGPVFAPDTVADVITGIEERGCSARPTRCCRDTWAPTRSPTSSSTRSRGSRRPTPTRSTAPTR
ncbi:hypothetical protein GCM10025872_36950 [Barrientosiimonas endolithica]|uniref:pyridoxal kinase n=1 Tax=Barrientosiimonas endolithica TaxID=1535208 RepID=A0ABN6YYV6_9MICO|nr:hypothetical protein GCM10025872_36950 [Barrientosiimonas endolithica]